jgi:hypothetical protein
VAILNRHSSLGDDLKVTYPSGFHIELGTCKR